VSIEGISEESTATGYRVQANGGPDSAPICVAVLLPAAKTRDLFEWPSASFRASPDWRYAALERSTDRGFAD